MMKSMKKPFLLSTLMALAITTSLSTTLSQGMPSLTLLDHDEDAGQTQFESPLSTSLRGSNRFLAQRKPRAGMTCNVYPRICRVKGSPGPDCCKKKCVNVTTDGLNCGTCGKKCKYPETCCKGKCVNVMSDKKHCGNCNNKCKKGSKCSFGMCSYA